MLTYSDYQNTLPTVRYRHVKDFGTGEHRKLNVVFQREQTCTAQNMLKLETVWHIVSY